MADSDANSKKRQTKNNRKRKLRSPEETERPPKTHRSENWREQTEVGHVQELERRELNQELLGEGSPWRNLQLILSLQNKELDIQKLVSFSISVFVFIRGILFGFRESSVRGMKFEIQYRIFVYFARFFSKAPSLSKIISVVICLVAEELIL
jgi:hypothetical protein